MRARRPQRSPQPGSAPGRPQPRPPPTRRPRRSGRVRGPALVPPVLPVPRSLPGRDVLGPASPLRGLPAPLRPRGRRFSPVPAARTHSPAATALSPGWRGVAWRGPARHLPRGRRAGTAAPPASLRRPQPARPGAAPRRARGLSRKPFKGEMHYIRSDAISEYSWLKGTHKDRCVQLLVLPRTAPRITPCA